jgi:hypothetical protein
MQSTILTGLPPSEHGAVANGWYFRGLGEVYFWRQSSRLVAGERVWEAARARNPEFTCANLFWWYAMHGTADISVTPRPMYLADGRKIPDIWASPPGLRETLTQQLGPFPLFQFWGPGSNIASSRWIAACGLYVRRTSAPTLTLVYLPHLDYDLQRNGPDDPAIGTALRDIDTTCGTLIADAERDGAAVIVLSEYGIAAVDTAIHVNRALRTAGWLLVRREESGEHLDLAASAAFAVADHQIAHIYVTRPERVADVASVVSALPGVDHVGDPGEFGLDHARSGELVALAKPNAYTRQCRLARRNWSLGSVVTGGGLILWALYRLAYGSRHQARIGMQVGFAGLLAWSFLMASAHGAGLMLVPALVPLCLARSGAGDITTVDALINSLAAVGVHAAALVSISGIIAILVYDWIGVGFLRRGWINLDWLWTGALGITGMMVLVH